MESEVFVEWTDHTTILGQHDCSLTLLSHNLSRPHHVTHQIKIQGSDNIFNSNHKSEFRWRICKRANIEMERTGQLLSNYKQHEYTEYECEGIRIHKSNVCTCRWMCVSSMRLEAGHAVGVDDQLRAAGTVQVHTTGSLTNQNNNSIT